MFIYICMYVYIYTHRFGNHSESLKMKAPSSSRLKPSGREGSRQRFQKEGPTSFGAVATMTWTWIGSHAIALALHWFKMFKGSCTIPWYLVGENMKRTQKKLVGSPQVRRALQRWDTAQNTTLPPRCEPSVRWQPWRVDVDKRKHTLW